LISSSRTILLVAAAAFQPLSAPASAQSTTRVSVDSNGLEHHGICMTSSISEDGRFVAFASNASDLVPGDTNGMEDVFVRDRLLGLTTRVSVSSTGAQANGKCEFPSISADGRYVIFTGWADNLIVSDANGETDIFLHDRETQETVRVVVGLGGAEPDDYSWHSAISADGNHVAFVSEARNLVPGDTNYAEDAFVFDRLTGQTTRVSVSSSGGESDRDVLSLSISGDGNRVAFMTRATNLVPGDTNGLDDVFVHDRLTGQTTRVSVDSSGMQSNGHCFEPAISADGGYVAFGSAAENLVLGDTLGHDDIFVHDLLTGQTSRVSLRSSGAEANGPSVSPAISASGRHVLFASRARNLVEGDTNGFYDVFHHDRATGQTSRVSVTSSLEQANRESEFPAISADGEFACFLSGATNLVPGDTNSRVDVFVHERIARMQVFGGCRGRLEVEIRDATPWGRLAVFYGPAGSHPLTNGPCAGLVLDLASPVIGAMLVADATGSAKWGLHVPVNLCGQSLQAVDVEGCDVTLPVEIEPRMLELTRTGICSARATVHLKVTDATPGRRVAMLTGAAGSFLMPRDPCRGVLLGLSQPSLLAVVVADQEGNATYSFIPPPALCGQTAQAVELATCTLSNTVLF